MVIHSELTRAIIFLFRSGICVKYSYFDQTFHIPLIIRDPTPGTHQTRGTVVDAFTECIDVMPTIVEAIGVEIPAQRDGYSPLPDLFFDHKQDPDEFLDLAADPAYQELVLEYAGKMLSWRMEHDEPGLTDLNLTRDGIVRELRSR